MAARELFAKMAGSLDSNRKIRRGGRNAREVYLWVLRQVALRDSAGGIPLADVQDAAYLADQLMCSEAESREGFERAVTVALLAVTESECLIVGWDEEWGRRPLSNAERQARHKEKVRAVATLRDSTTDEVTEAPLLVTDNVTGNAGEERRGEERRSRSASPPTPILTLESPSPATPRPDRKKPARAMPADFAPTDSHRAFCAANGIDLAVQVEKFRVHHEAKGSVFASWPAALTKWLGNAVEYRHRDGAARPTATSPTYRTVTDEELS